MVRTLLAALLLSGCASAPIVYTYPSGLRVIRADQFVLAQACGAREGHYDDGRYRRKGEAGIGCWDGANKTVYIEDSCRGAKALIHERAHEEGIKDPRAEGFDWR